MAIPSYTEVLDEAKHVAEVYDRTREWLSWSDNAREDFWSIACDTLRVPESERPEYKLD